MPVFAGRIDAIYDEIEDELTMIDVFQLFEEAFDIKNYVFVFEHMDKTQTFERKGHYHFFYESDAKHDTQRRFLTKLGFKKDLAMIKQCEDLKTTYEPYSNSLIHYTLKHVKDITDIVYTDFPEDIIGFYIKSSIAYNEALKKTTKPNLKRDIVELILKSFEGKQPHKISRADILKEINKVYLEVNTNEEGEVITFQQYQPIPTGNELLKLVQYIETKVCPVKAREEWFLDNCKLLRVELNEWESYTKPSISQQFKESIYEKLI